MSDGSTCGLIKSCGLIISQRKKKLHLSAVAELLRRFNFYQIPLIDFGSGARKVIAILRLPTHRKRGLNGRNQNFMHIASLRRETLYTLSQFERKFHKQKNA